MDACIAGADFEKGSRVLQTLTTHAPERIALPGLHLIGDLHGCTCELDKMVDREWLRDRCLALVAEAGLTPAGDFFHGFDGGGGVTGTVVLSESHLSLHTWPENRYVTLDVYVCNYSEDNRDKARRLFDRLVQTFAPQQPRFFALDRI